VITPTGTLQTDVAFRVLAGTTYDISFSPLFGLNPTSGSFTYDAKSGFSNFTVLWNGLKFDLTESANHPTISSSGCKSEMSNAAYSFALMSQSLTNCRAPFYSWSQDYVNIGTTTFSFSVSANRGSDEITQTSPMPVQNIGNSTGGWSIAPRQ